ncbi:TadE/TadG family type IV pilus assembly protein [Pyxidicoccus trucidator]|uniref:TadE/TadG family type IV pilus assembly protein n=1 Tax=Pyxidicoccus trucidator TaxID=2709662 RepID=UPI0013DAA30F|nr:pilus assembly protein [Pyxidicoccus trucidator]
MNPHVPMRRRKSRGAALVETALGATLMVTVIAFGIHFAEVGYLSLKVQEAAISALWHGTHGTMHRTATDYSKADDTMRAAGADAQRRYADFNGLSSVNNPPGITQVFTRGRDMQVNCDVGGDPDWDGALLTQLIYRDRGAAHCESQATLDLFRFPTSFLDQGGGALYKQEHADDRFGNLRVCGMGRPVAGACNGRISMLVDDWGLASSGAISETLTCQMPFGQMPYELDPPIFVPIPCANLPFYAAVLGTYAPTALIIPPMSDFMPLGVLQFPAPIKSRYFFMSAPGEEVVFLQVPTLDQPGGASGMFATTPGSVLALSTPWYGISYGMRVANRGCFLGKDCD